MLSDTGTDSMSHLMTSSSVWFDRGESNNHRARPTQYLASISWAGILILGPRPLLPPAHCLSTRKFFDFVVSCHRSGTCFLPQRGKQNWHFRCSRKYFAITLASIEEKATPSGFYCTTRFIVASFGASSFCYLTSFDASDGVSSPSSNQLVQTPMQEVNYERLSRSRTEEEGTEH